MTITKHLHTDKDDNDGLYPVMIKVALNGVSRMIPTDVACKAEHWLPKACRISCGDPLQKIKNEMIDAQFRRIAGKIQRNIDDFLFNNIDRILLNPESPEENPINILPASCPYNKCFINFIDSKINSISNINTRRGYKSFRRYFLSRYGDGPSATEIDKKFINTFDTGLKQDFMKNKPTRHLMLSRLRAVINHAYDNGDLPQSLSFKLPKSPFRPRDRNLSNSSVLKIFKLYNSLIKSDPEISYPSTFSVAIFILDIAFQGLAPVDLASLKIKQLRRHTISPPDNESLTNRHLQLPTSGIENNPSSPIDVVIINTARQKTGQQLTIVADWTPLKPILEKLMKGKTPEDYLLPCFNNNIHKTPDQRQNRLANYFHKLSYHLNRTLSYNGIDNDEAGEKRRITFYYARHAFCNLVDSLDVPRHIIQHMIGHRTTVLENNYLRRITPWEQALLSRKILAHLNQEI